MTKRTNLEVARVAAATFAMAADSGRKVKLDPDDSRRTADTLWSLIREVERYRDAIDEAREVLAEGDPPYAAAVLTTARNFG